MHTMFIFILAKILLESLKITVIVIIPTRSIFISVFKLNSCNIDNMEKMITSSMDTEMQLDPYLLFSNTIRSPLSNEKYRSCLNYFFDFIVLPKLSLNDRCKVFIKKSIENSSYTLNCAFKFVIF